MKSTRAAGPTGASREPKAVPLDAASELLRREAWGVLERGLRGGPKAETIALTVRAPRAPIERMLGALPHEEAFCFAPAGERAAAALGAAFRIETNGSPPRLTEAREVLARLFEGLELRSAPGAMVVVPRAMLGIAFEPEGGASAPWEELGAGALVLPRWTYWRDGDDAALTLIVRPEEAFAEARAEAELSAIFGALALPSDDAPFPQAISRVAHSSEADWAALVERIQIALRRGEAAKIVAARRTCVYAESAIDPVGVFTRIGAAPEGAARYFVRRGATAFVGCSPERLFVKRGRSLETEALAGSINPTDEDGEARLSASAKDRDEHARVVEHLVERLGPLSVRVEAAASPRIRRLPTVLHLLTPVSAELSPGVDALSVIEALHPTPAVGGTPPDRARRFIAEHEPDRGWYASPLGFIDARGDAEIFVGLRCVVVRGECAHLWAGAGIVAASEAGPEWSETELKMRPMLRALGVDDR